MQVRLHCRQYPQCRSGPDHFCISHLKDDKESNFLKSLGKLFHNLLHWYFSAANSFELLGGPTGYQVGELGSPTKNLVAQQLVRGREVKSRRECGRDFPSC